VADESKVLGILREQFPEDVLETRSALGDETVLIRGTRMHEVMEFLKGDSQLRFEMLLDITAVDYLGKKDARFEVVYHLLSLKYGYRLRVIAPLTGDEPRIPSISSIFRSANWAEREVAEFFGIYFDGHPDLRKLLLYDEFHGYPLRKDYPLKKRQPLVQYRSGAALEIHGRDCQ